MRKLLPFLLVVVYMNSGKVYRYENAQSFCDDAAVYYISTDEPYACNGHAGVLATFPLASVERIEVAK